MLQIDGMARSPSDKTKIGGNCIEEVMLGARRASEQAPRDLHVQGRKPFPGHVVIAALMDFLRKSRSERDAILRRELAAYEEMLAQDEPGDVFFPGERSPSVEAVSPTGKAMPTSDRMGHVKLSEPEHPVSRLPKNPKRPTRK